MGRYMWCGVVRADICGCIWARTVRYIIVLTVITDMGSSASMCADVEHYGSKIVQRCEKILVRVGVSMDGRKIEL